MRENLKLLKDQLDKTTDPSEYQRLTKAIVDQKNQIQQAAAASNGFANSTFGVSRAARIAHSDLDQTVRSMSLLSSGAEGAGEGLSNLVFTFERLKGVTGSTGGAIAALGEAFLGPAGIVLALTTAASAFGPFIAGLFDNNEALAKAKLALEGYNNTLADTKKAVEDLKTGLNFSNELGALNAEIANLPKSLDLQGAAVAQREFTQGIIDNQAKVRDALDHLANDQDLSEKDRIAKQKEFNDQLDALIKDEEESKRKEVVIYRQIALQKNKEQDEADKKALEASKKALEEQKRLAKLRADAEAERQKNLVVFKAPDKLDVPSVRNLEATFDAFKADVNKKPIVIDIPIAPRIQAHLDDLEKLKKEIKAHVDELNSIVKDGLADVAASFAQGIGQAFATGDVAGIFAGTFKAIGGALQALGKAMIAHAIAVQAFKAAFKNPVAELAAGAGLLIAGAALQAALSKSTKFAKGGIVTGPTNALIGEAGTEVVMPLDRLKGLLGGLALSGETTVMHKISGNELLLLINRTGKTNNRSF